MSKADFPLLAGWLHQPHVLQWWRDPQATLDEVAIKYGGRVLGSEPTDVYIAQVGSTPIGLIQSYWNRDYPEHDATIQLPDSVGIDLFIGEPAFVGKGYGPKQLMVFALKA